MEYILIVCIGLILLNIFQFFFWSKQVHKLVDKLMSRNYAEYVSIKNPPLPTVSEDDLGEESDILEELNDMVGRWAYLT